MLKIFRALALGLALVASPALAANQAPTVMPLSGPMAFSVFLSTYLNPAIQAVLTCNWGPSAPTNGPSSSATAYQCWADTTTNPVLFKYYDGAQWVIFGDLNTTTHVWRPYLTGGTSGGVPFFSATNIMGSSGLLALNGVMFGGGAGAAPATIAACTDDQIIFGRTGLAPLCRTVSGDITFTAGVSAIGTAKVTSAMLRNSAALSIIGRSANSIGVPADIAATAASDAVMRESGSTIGFGTINTAGITNNAVTDAKLRAGGALTIMGRSANTGGNVADIAAIAGSDCVYRENASTLACGTLNTAGIANSAVTNAKLANAAAFTLKGNFTGSAAAPQDVAIGSLTNKASPASTDILILQDQAASGAIKYCTIAQCVGALASGVSSIASNTGAFTLGNGLTNATNEIRLWASLMQGLVAKNGSNLELQRANGRYIFINGAVELIPSSAPTLAAPATTLTLYYIYAFMSAGTLTLEASTTAYAVDSTYGHKVKSGDTTRTLVGMARTVSSAWVDSATQRFVRSLFNEISKPSMAQNANNGAASTNTRVEIDSAKRLEFLLWSGEKVVVSISTTSYFTVTAPNQAELDVGFDATTAESPAKMRIVTGDNNISYGGATTAIKDSLAEGYHYATGTLFYVTGATNSQIAANTVFLRGQVL